MPPLETMDRHQHATYWAKAGNDGYGEPTISAGVEIVVRWVTKRREAINTDGVPIALDATVITNRRIEPGSILWLGRLADFVDDGDNELMIAATYDEASDLKNRHTRYEIGLQRFRDTLPTIAS
jgi:hypothetical protein